MPMCFFFSSRRRHTRLQGDWSSDVCSSDLQASAVDVVYLVVGKMTSLLAGIHPGEHLEVWGPLGNGFPDLKGVSHVGLVARSEERRVGKECRSRWSPYH